MKTQYVWIVLERWNLDLMETDASVFSTEALAQAFAKAQASLMRGMIDDSVVNYNKGDCFVCVEKEDGYDDEWWEARIVKRGINYEKRKPNEIDEAWTSLDECIDTIAKNEKGK